MNAVTPPSPPLTTHLGDRLLSLLVREGRGTPNASLVSAVDQNAQH
jgi:hypothetical protein